MLPGPACLSKELRRRPCLLELEEKGEEVAPWTVSCERFMLCFSRLVKCLKNTPAFFAERLNKAMRVRIFPVEGPGRGGGVGGEVRSSASPVAGTSPPGRRHGESYPSAKRTE